MEESKLLWNPAKITLLLRVKKPEFSQDIGVYAKDHGYVIKPEFHASIIGLQNGKKLSTRYSDDSEMIQKIRSLADNFLWEVITSQDYFVIEKYYNQEELTKSGYQDILPHIRKTIIQKITLPDIEKFYENLTQLTDLDFEIPFAHITLFAWSDYLPMMTQGIGLYSEDDFEKFCKEKI